MAGERRISAALRAVMSAKSTSIQSVAAAPPEAAWSAQWRKYVVSMPGGGAAARAGDRREEKGRVRNGAVGIS
jgi:hypothetical protein